MGLGASIIATGKIGIAPKGNLELVADDFQLIGNVNSTIVLMMDFNEDFSNDFIQASVDITVTDIHL